MLQVTSPTSLAVDAPQGRKLFVFDKVFGEEVQQDGVWEYLAESVNAFLQGYNVSVMAYGQSGAGKSYTMGTSGPAEQSDEELMGRFPFPEAAGDIGQEGNGKADEVGIGVIPRAARVLFDRLMPMPELRRTGSGIKKPNRYSMSSIPAVNGTKPSRGGDKDWKLKATYVEVRCVIFSPSFR